MVVVASVVGLAAYFKNPNQRSRTIEQPEATAPVIPTAFPLTSSVPAPVAAAPTPPPAPVIAPEDTFPAEARKFGNARYRFEVSEKGFIQALANTGDELLIESAGGISLQGSYVGSDGRRKWFNVGGVDDAGYLATVKKSVEAGITVFNVQVTHPRFELTQSFTCLPGSVKVSAKFTPINLRDPRGVIAAVLSVRLSPVTLDPSVRMRTETDRFTYTVKSGPLSVGFDNTSWARDAADGRQTIVAGENGVAFHFTDSTEPNRNTLTYEISVP